MHIYSVSMMRVLLRRVVNAARIHQGLYNSPFLVYSRCYYMWLNFVFNRVDYSRIEEFGPDRVAAEWILRCGGGVKFLNKESWIWDYNALPEGPREKYLLEKINAKGVSVTTGGLLHLEGMNHLTHLNLNSCKYVTDLSKLLPVKDTLTELDVGNCIGFSDIFPLHQFKMLKRLNLVGCTRIKDRQTEIISLQKQLPRCVIDS